MGKETVITGEWCDTASVMRALGISERTVQKWAEIGRLPFKTVQDGSRRFRLYDAAEVEKLRKSGPPKAPSKPPHSRGNADVTIGRRALAVAAAKSPGAEAAVMLAKDVTAMMTGLAEKLLGQYDKQRDADRAAEAERLKAENRRSRREHAARLLKEKSWLTPKECYRLEGLPAKAAVELAERGELDGVLVDGAWHIRRASLQEFSQKRGASKRLAAVAGKEFSRAT